MALVSLGTCACNTQLLEFSIAKEVGSIWRDAQRKFGCEYYTAVSCAIGKDSRCQMTSNAVEDRKEIGRCSHHKVAQDIEQETKSALAKARSKFGCPKTFESLHCVRDSRGWVTCSLSGSEVHRSAQSSGCDVSIFSDKLAEEIQEMIEKAVRKWNCPRASAVMCVTEHQHAVECTLVAPAHEERSCDMQFLTNSLANEIGEELLEASINYGCTIPSTLNCEMHQSEHLAPRFMCHLVDSTSESLGEQPSTSGNSATSKSGPQPPDSPHPDQKVRSWSHRHLRSRREI